ncbi:uncharacterized protein LOC117795957 [Ailuropoda melanoleuca]|uniref:uncharacterized protein LOC117795957 n=1 Tax=Ailuropoda melanoleuca TaxID=9646 RepID=UPI001494C958|nr:uncharacterized protein LOC117795957 [Ailuropoda melanoleuca]
MGLRELYDCGEGLKGLNCDPGQLSHRDGSGALLFSEPSIAAYCAPLLETRTHIAPMASPTHFLVRPCPFCQTLFQSSLPLPLRPVTGDQDPHCSHGFPNPFPGPALSILPNSLPVFPAFAPEAPQGSSRSFLIPHGGRWTSLPLRILLGQPLTPPYTLCFCNSLSRKPQWEVPLHPHNFDFYSQAPCFFALDGKYHFLHITVSYQEGLYSQRLRLWRVTPGSGVRLWGKESKRSQDGHCRDLFFLGSLDLGVTRPRFLSQSYSQLTLFLFLSVLICKMGQCQSPQVPRVCSTSEKRLPPFLYPAPAPRRLLLGCLGPISPAPLALLPKTFQKHSCCQVRRAGVSRLLPAPQKNPRWTEVGKRDAGCSGNSDY